MTKIVFMKARKAFTLFLLTHLLGINLVAGGIVGKRKARGLRSIVPDPIAYKKKLHQLMLNPKFRKKYPKLKLAFHNKRISYPLSHKRIYRRNKINKLYKNYYKK